jgi:ABC-2 type transport system permease protein
VFLALGAACSDPREAQALMLPVMGVLVLPMALLPNVVGDPQGPAAVAVTFYPPAAPLYLLLRVAVPPGVPWWQLGVSVLLVAALTLATVWAAGRIFRVGLLVQGRGATWGEMARWVVRG